MKGLKKFLGIFAYLGILAGFILLYMASATENVTLGVAALVLLTLSGWVMAFGYVHMGLSIFSALLKSE